MKTRNIALLGCLVATACIVSWSYLHKAPISKRLPRVTYSIVEDDGTPRRLIDLFPSIAKRSRDASLADLSTQAEHDDTIEFRIWIESNHLLGMEAIVLRRDNGTSRGWHLPHGSPARLIEMSEPKSGWRYVWETIESAGIYGLPDSSSLPRTGTEGDGSFYYIEFSKEGQFREYSYGNPERHDWPEGKSLLKIVSMLKDEF